MENFENNPIPQEEPMPEIVNQEEPAPEVIQQEEPAPVITREELIPEPRQEIPFQQSRPVSEPYSGIGVGRKESPFADSPYEMHHEPKRTYQNTYVPPVPPQQPPVKPKKPKNPNAGKVWKRILCTVLALAVVAGSCGITAALVNKHWEERTERMEDQFEDRLEMMQKEIDAAAAAAAAATGGNSVSGTVAVGDGLTPGQVYARNVQSVVLITCEVKTNVYGQSVTGSSSGSGFVLTEDGYVVTNAHVVDGATTITVSTPSGDAMEAKLIGTDTTNDVAVLKVEAEGLSPVTIGSSDALIVGDQVVAIGNPLGDLTSTMTVGYVSAKDRDVTTDGTTINMLQTDAAINSGNSGGPLFNMKGEVVGITTAKYSGSSSSGAAIESIGFAIPIDDVIGMINDLKDYGYVTGAYLGVMVSNVPEDIAAYYRLPVGARVEEVTPGYCAEEAGLQAGDIIVALGGHEVENITDLTRALRKFKPGDTTQITVFRGGAVLDLPITLDEKPASTQSAPSESGKGEMPENGSYEEWRDYFFGDED